MKKTDWEDWDNSSYCKICGKELTNFEESKNGICGECARKKHIEKTRRCMRRRRNEEIIEDY